MQNFTNSAGKIICEKCSYSLRNLMQEKTYLLYVTDEQTNGYPLYTIYNYQDIIRGLILRAKIQGDHVALKIISSLFFCSPTIQQILLHAATVTPAPSSFWGRIRGRFDVPDFLCQEIAKKNKTKVETLQNRLFWKLNKRARLEQKGRVFIKESFLATPSQEKLHVIIDDIVTTGHTLRRVAEKHDSENLVFVALANATNN